MSGLIEHATAILAGSERRLETISNNVANLSTPGFKRQISFSRVLAAAGSAGAEAGVDFRHDWSQGKIGNSGNPLDLAISGAGFFQLRKGSETFYSRQGHFALAEDGTVVTPQGYALQQSGGGDLVLERGAVEILGDGTVVEGGRPIARIAIFDSTDAAAIAPVAGSLFTIADSSLEESAGATIRQGMVEASNVAIGDEMVSMMAALRQAESGARLVQLYDDLIGRAITAFGQGGR